MRPENGRGLWRDALRGAINEVARGPTAHAMVPVDTRDIADADDLIRVLPADTCHDTRIGQAIDMIHTAGGRLRVRDIAQILSWSPRHLHRVFSSHVGLAFKTYGNWCNSTGPCGCSSTTSSRSQTQCLRPVTLIMLISRGASVSLVALSPRRFQKTLLYQRCLCRDVRFLQDVAFSRH